MNHLTIRQSVIGSVYAKRRRESFFGVYGTPDAALCLQDLGKGGNSLEVVRSSDSAIAEFNYPQITDGTLLAWVNGANNEVMNDPNISSDLEWTIGGNTTFNAGTEAFDLAGETGLTVRQDQSEEGIEYEVTFTISSYSSGEIRVYAGGNQSNTFNSPGTHTVTIIGGSSNAILGINPSGGATTLSISSFGAIQKTAKGEARTIYGPNGINFIQTTSSERALIVDNGVLVEENGRPALKCNGSTTNYDLSSPVVLSDEFYILTVLKTTSENTYGLLGGSNANDDSILIFATQLRVKIDSTNNSNSGAAGNQNQQRLFEFSRDASNNLDTTRDGALYGSTISGASGTFTLNVIGTNIALNSINGTLQEVLIYSADKSSQAADIRANRNDYYSIY